MFASLFQTNKHLWEPRKQHRTWRIQNHPININDTHIAYLTDFNVGESGVVLYNIQQDKCEVFKYPKHLKPEEHCYCYYQQKIYIVNTDGSIITFDLDTKQFTEIKRIQNQRRIGSFASCFNIGDDFIHIIGGSDNQYYLTYSVSHNEYQIAADFRVGIQHPCIVKNRSQTKVFMFSGYVNNKIYVGTVSQDQHTANAPKSIQWEKCKDLSIPNRLKDCGHIMYRNHIILFGGNTGFDKEYSNEIYVIDTKRQKQRKVSNVQCPQKDNYHAVYIDHKIHLFGLKNNHSKHFAATLDNIVQIDDAEEQEEVGANDLDLNDMEHDEKEPDGQHLNENQQKLINEKNLEISKLRQELCSVKVEKSTLQQLVSRLQQETQQLHAENEQLKQRNCQLHDELKECQKRGGGADLNRFDLAKYKEWNSETVVSWILSLEDGVFAVYQSTLEAVLKSDYIGGEELREINNHEYLKMKVGIKSYNHRALLIKHINALVIQTQDEGGNTALLN